MKFGQIDRLLYLTDEELTAREKARLEVHLRDCQVCRAVRQEVMANRTRLSDLFVSETPDKETSMPVIKLDHTAARRNPPATERILSVVRWISSAAAAALLILFISEQVSSVRKISKLETSASVASYEQAPGLLDRWTLDQLPVNPEIRQKLLHHIKAAQSSGGLFSSGQFRLSKYLALFPAGKYEKSTFQNIIK
jgi:hypothetical protein